MLGTDRFGLGGSALAQEHLPRTLPGHLRRAGLLPTGRHLIPLFNPRYEQDTYSALTIETIARFVTGRQGLTPADVDAWMADLRERGAVGREGLSQ